MRSLFEICSQKIGYNNGKCDIQNRGEERKSAREDRFYRKNLQQASKSNALILPEPPTRSSLEKATSGPSALLSRDNTFILEREYLQGCRFDLAFPSDYEIRLRRCIWLINKPGFCIEQSHAIELELRRLAEEKSPSMDAHLWLGIVKRANLQDAKREFNYVLILEPQNRLASLNIVANFITSKDNPGFKAWPRVVSAEEKQFYQAWISDYVYKNPEDCFARLIEAIAVENDDFLICHQKLKKLHADWPDFTPATALLARECYNSHNFSPAFKLAKDALSRCPENLLAARIVSDIRHGKSVDESNFYEMRRTVPYNGDHPCQGIEAVFQAPYSFQDPLWRLKDATEDRQNFKHNLLNP